MILKAIKTVCKQSSRVQNQRTINIYRVYIPYEKYKNHVCTKFKLFSVFTFKAVGYQTYLCKVLIRFALKKDKITMRMKLVFTIRQGHCRLLLFSQQIHISPEVSEPFPFFNLLYIMWCFTMTVVYLRLPQNRAIYKNDVMSRNRYFVNKQTNKQTKNNTHHLHVSMYLPAQNMPTRAHHAHPYIHPTVPPHKTPNIPYPTSCTPCAHTLNNAQHSTHAMTLPLTHPYTSAVQS